MKENIEQYLQNKFLYYYNSNGRNPIWSVDSLEHEVFVEHYFEFEKLDKEDQWIIRNYIDALRKVYGEKHN